jgi:hypothetical protein
MNHIPANLPDVLLAIFGFFVLAIVAGRHAAKKQREYDGILFGPHGVLMRDSITDELRPMTDDDLEEMRAEVNLREEEEWVELESKAYFQYGPGVRMWN